MTKLIKNIRAVLHILSNVHIFISSKYVETKLFFKSVCYSCLMSEAKFVKQRFIFEISKWNYVTLHGAIWRIYIYLWFYFISACGRATLRWHNILLLLSRHQRPAVLYLFCLFIQVIDIQSGISCFSEIIQFTPRLLHKCLFLLPYQVKFSRAC